MLKPLITPKSFSLLVFLIAVIGTGYSYFSSPAAEIVPPTRLVAGSDSNSVAEQTGAQISAELTSLRKQLYAQQQKNDRHTREIKRLSSLLASSEFSEDFSCDDEEDEYYPSEREINWQRQENDRIAAQYEDRLAAETLDPEHSESVESEINGILTTRNSSGATLSDVSCAESLCRIELEYDDQDAQDLFTSHFAQMLMEMHGESFFQLLENDNGSSSGILFLSRDASGVSEAEI